MGGTTSEIAEKIEALEKERAKIGEDALIRKLEIDEYEKISKLPPGQERDDRFERVQSGEFAKTEMTRSRSRTLREAKWKRWKRQLNGDELEVTNTHHEWMISLILCLMDPLFTTSSNTRRM